MDTLNLTAIIGASLAVFGILVVFVLDRLMFGYVTFLGPIIISVGIALILLGLMVRIKDRSQNNSVSEKNSSR
jgi:hypothetical protein